MLKQATFIQKGTVIDYMATADISVGEVVPLVAMVGVAQANIPNGGTGSLDIEGIFECPAINTVAFSVGDQLYWDETANQLTKISTNNTLAGKCTTIKAQSGNMASVKINR